MMHRSTALLGMIVVAVGAALPGSAQAGSILTFQFKNNTGGPVSRADFSVIPAGSVKAPIIGNDPETGLPRTASPVTIDAARSSGFDPDNFSTALGTGTSVQGLRLLFGQKQVIKDGRIVFEPVFGPNGEAPRYLDNGGTVTFDLSLDPAFEGLLTLRSLTQGIDNPIIVASSGTGGGNGGGSGGNPPPSIPEPLSITLWSVAAGVGLLKARRRAATAA